MTAMVIVFIGGIKKEHSVATSSGLQCFAPHPIFFLVTRRVAVTHYLYSWVERVGVVVEYIVLFKNTTK